MNIDSFSVLAQIPNSPSIIDNLPLYFVIASGVATAIAVAATYLAYRQGAIRVKVVNDLRANGFDISWIQRLVKELKEKQKHIKYSDILPPGNNRFFYIPLSNINDLASVEMVIIEEQLKGQPGPTYSKCL